MENITTGAKSGKITNSEEIKQPNGLDSDTDLFTLCGPECMLCRTSPSTEI